MKLPDCRLIEFPKIPDHRGNLTFVESGRHIPFDIARAYYLYDVPGEAVRGGHAHRSTQEILVAITGSFDVTLTDGTSKSTVTLRRSNEGLLIPRMIWRDLSRFTSGAICLVFASDFYDEADYIRDYDQFLGAVGAGE